jgi:hypothetical protein
MNRLGLLLLPGLLALSLTGCELFHIDGSNPLPGEFAELEFGDGYDVATYLTNPDNTLRDVRPLLDGDTLQVTVQYGGGCKEHTFEVQARTRGAAAELWMRHDANDDLCEAYLTETLRLPVPPQALGASTITLLAPGGHTFDLR